MEQNYEDIANNVSGVQQSVEREKSNLRAVSDGNTGPI
jgi:hypothetical protein